MAFSSGDQVFRTSRSVLAGRDGQDGKTARARRALSSDSGAAAGRAVRELGRLNGGWGLGNKGRTTGEAGQADVAGGVVEAGGRRRGAGRLGQSWRQRPAAAFASVDASMGKRRTGPGPMPTGWAGPITSGHLFLCFFFFLSFRFFFFLLCLLCFSFFFFPFLCF